jgi:hypothetical protein
MMVIGFRCLCLPVLLLLTGPICDPGHVMSDSKALQSSYPWFRVCKVKLRHTLSRMRGVLKYGHSSEMVFLVYVNSVQRLLIFNI